MQTVSNFKTTLSSSVSSSQNTLPVSSIVTTDGHTLTIADFASTSGFCVIESGGSKMELCKFTGITNNGDGSGILTGVTRGLAFYGTDSSAVSANQYAHQSGSSVIISNVHYIYEQLVDKVSDETIAGIKTFSSLPLVTAGNATTDNQLVRYAQLIAATTGSATVPKLIVAGTAGATLVAGNAVYLDPTDQEWKLTDADTAGTVNNVLLGIAQGAGTDGNPITNGVLIWGYDTNQSGLTVGKQFFGNTAGGFSSSAGTVEVSAGIAISTTAILFYPRYDQQITENEQDALAGSSGTPSASNKYITEDDVSNAGASGKIVRATGTALPALSGANLTGVVTSQSRKVIISSSQTTVNNTVSETNIFSVSLAGNLLSTNNGVYIRIPISDLDTSIGAGTDLTVNLKYGGSTVATFATATRTVAASNWAGYIEAYLLASGATNTQKGIIQMNVGEKVGNDDNAYNLSLIHI